MWSSWAKVQRALSSFQRHVTETHTPEWSQTFHLPHQGVLETRLRCQGIVDAIETLHLHSTQKNLGFFFFLHELSRYTMAFSGEYLVLGLSFPVFLGLFITQSTISCLMSHPEKRTYASYIISYCEEPCSRICDAWLLNCNHNLNQ